jgi:CRISPR-associated protein Cst2
MATTIYGLAVSAKATLNMHSLNNEGGEGNQIQTRMVDVMHTDGKLYQVNAVSGDMFKHIQAEHLFRLAQANGHALCAACARFDANRISGDDNFMRRIEANKYTNVQTVNDMLRTCVMDDLEGILITAGKRSVPRKSVAEFGWVVGVPDEVRTEQYFHVKYNPQVRNREEAAVSAAVGASQDSGGAIAGSDGTEDRSGNLGQAIFHRPASSGNYAIVTYLEAARIGYNDISQQYALDDAERTARLRILLQSLLHTFVQPNGAMRNTQLPHLVEVAGVISVSHAMLPAPTISPLNSAYVSQIKGVASALNSLASQNPPNGNDGAGNDQESVSIYEFNSLSQFAETMATLADQAVPYRFIER